MEAEALAHTLTSPRGSDVLTRLAAAIAEAGDLDRAEAVARTISEPDAQALALATLVGPAAQRGDLDRADRLITDAAGLAHHNRAEVLLRLTEASAATPALDDACQRLAVEAEALARTIQWPDDKAEALTRLVAVVGSRLAADAEAAARDAREEEEMSAALHRLAAVIAQTGDLDRAEALARTITHRNADTVSPALASVASAAARAGDFDRAEALARTITNARAKARAAIDLIAASARTGDLDRAKHLWALVLAVDDPQLWLAESAAEFFPSVGEYAWDILAAVYATPDA
jgi:hypothetical protein